MQQMMLRAEPSEVYNEGLRELSSEILRTNASMSVYLTIMSSTPKAVFNLYKGAAKEYTIDY